MQIVVLDGHTLNPGDLSWEPLERLGPTTIHSRTPAEQVVERAAGAEIVITNKALLPRAAIEQLPALQYIGVTATGVNIVDVEAARERGIPVCNVPSYGTKSVAQMAFAHVLNLSQRVAEHAQLVRDGRWRDSQDFCFWDFPLIELAGRTMGIVGLGAIGRETARLAGAFGMQVIAATRTAPDDAPDVRIVDLDTLFAESDIVSLHCPLTDETRHLVNRERLARMKPTALLINTSRGPLIDEAALAAALIAGQLAGAGLDVLSEEPPRGENPLLAAPNCYVTPHIAWATSAARARLMQASVENVAAFLAGEPQNVVNP
ncbi:MAG: D-2-hydroxyacid dehydrogenase [Planctomycetales bacterium]|nr:D-2-hydroxyacid dehydrogenase [Planctomycetales bacterium]